MEYCTFKDIIQRLTSPGGGGGAFSLHFVYCKKKKNIRSKFRKETEILQINACECFKDLKKTFSTTD